MKIFKFVSLIVCTSVLGTGVTAQDLVLNLLSGESENHPVEEIRSIKFPGTAMVIYQHDGTVISVDISAISSYEFDMSTVSTDERDGHYSKVLKIYPNPASDRVQIAYTGRESTELFIEILDGSGRLIESLYRGGHAGETAAVWHPGASAKGSYLCRVTGKIIVQ